MEYVSSFLALYSRQWGRAVKEPLGANPPLQAFRGRYGILAGGIASDLVNRLLSVF
jgi:hypothetical protein